MVRRITPVAVALTLALGSAAAAQGRPDSAVAAGEAMARADTAALLAFGQRVNGWFWEAEADSLWAHAGEDARIFLRNPTQLGDQILGFVSQYGVETRMVSESLTGQGENFLYARVVQLDGSEVPWTVAWTFSPDFTIVNVSLDPGE